MNRIDEAMRRTGGPLRDATTVGAGNADVFVSAWTTERDSRESVGQLPMRHAAASGQMPPRQLQPTRTSIGDGFLVGWRERLVVSQDADQLLVHQFRRLVATLLQAQGNTR